jgi:hypothetical protein
MPLYNAGGDQVVSLSSPSQVGAASFATVFPAGNMAGLRVSFEPIQLFYEAFDAGLETVIKWNPAVAAGGGVAATNTPGSCAVGTGTTANGYSYLQSRPTFQPESPGWIYQAWAQNFEYPVALNAYRAFGGFIPAATPTAAIPFTEGYGWEITTAGKLCAVCYAGSTRNLIADLSPSTGTGKQPADGAPHNYVIYFRGDRILWFIDDLSNPVAQTFNGAPGPNTNTQGLTMMAIAGSTPPGVSLLNTANAIYVADTTGSAQGISDGQYPWRKVTVGPKAAQGANAMSVQAMVDSGRVNLIFSATGVAAGATGVETAITLSKAADTGATASAVSFVVTSGKRFRVTSITFGTQGNAAATAQATTFNLRINTAGAVVVATTPIVLSARSATAAVAGAYDRVTLPIPDGLEFLGTGTLQFGLTANSVFVTNAPVWDVLIAGFEY